MFNESKINRRYVFTFKSHYVENILFFVLDLRDKTSELNEKI